MRWIWLINPRRRALVPSKLSGKLSLGSRMWGEGKLGNVGSCGSKVVEIGRSCGSVRDGFVQMLAYNSQNESLKISFSSWSCCKAAIIWLRGSLESYIVIWKVNKLSRNCHETSTETERRDNGDQGTDKGRDVDISKQVLIPVTGVVHLDSTQGEHGYLYKNVWACMELE
jgi:hypothetical protein